MTQAGLPPVGSFCGLWWYGKPHSGTVDAVGRSRITVRFTNRGGQQRKVTAPWRGAIPFSIKRGTPAFAYPLTQQMEHSE